MKEKPILFNTEMVRAILDGRKTQTRRPIKRPAKVPQDYFLRGGVVDSPSVAWWNEPSGLNVGYSQHCPLGKPGDLLWVRETWAWGVSQDDIGAVYRATDPDWEDMDGWKWKPSIHMPRQASRITLEITGVRVERLQDISDEDTIAEGIWNVEELDVGDPMFLKSPPSNLRQTIYPTAKSAFQSLWQSTYSTKHPWQSNPWVWVVQFKLLEGSHAK